MNPLTGDDPAPDDYFIFHAFLMKLHTINL